MEEVSSIANPIKWLCVPLEGDRIYHYYYYYYDLTMSPLLMDIGRLGAPKDDDHTSTYSGEWQ